MHPFDLHGRVALVTGGNSGIGLAAARGLARAGAAVAIWGRRQDRNKAAAEELREFGVDALADAVDVSRPEQVTAGMGRVVEELGRVDVLFVNAGVARHAPSFLDISDEARFEVLDTNLHGSWECIRAGLRHMVHRADHDDPGGSIIVNGSLTVTRGLPGGEHYGAAKAGLASVVRGIAVTYARHGVRANMICPGFIERDGRPGRYEDVVSQRGPVARYGTPDEVAGAVVYLASDAASYHNGDVLTIDGGWSARVL